MEATRESNAKDKVQLTGISKKTFTVKSQIFLHKRTRHCAAMFSDDSVRALLKKPDYTFLGEFIPTTCTVGDGAGRRGRF